MAAGVGRLVNQNQTAPRAEDVDEGGEGGRTRERTRLEGSEAAGSERGGRAGRQAEAGTTHELTASTGNYALPPPNKLELPPNTIHHSTKVHQSTTG